MGIGQYPDCEHWAILIVLFLAVLDAVLVDSLPLPSPALKFELDHKLQPHPVISAITHDKCDIKDLCNFATIPVISTAIYVHLPAVSILLSRKRLENLGKMRLSRKTTVVSIANIPISR